MTSSLTGFRPRVRPPASGRALPSDPAEFLQNYVRNADGAIAAEYRGITADGTAREGLFPLRSTGVSTAPIQAAAAAFVASLSSEQQTRALFPVDSDMWRRWSNIHIYVMRHGVSFEDLSETQRQAAFALLGASLSSEGFTSARDIMKLNETIAEMTGRPDEYGEWLYWLSLYGTPSAEEPWGWQIDGHHLIVNCLVRGDQVVMTPMFMGSEPCEADSGKYAGTRVFEAEEQRGLAFMRSLSPEQQRTATVGMETLREVYGTAFRDNGELPYEGIRATDLSSEQQRRLLGVIETYTGRTRADHAAVKLDEVKQHLADTYFAWRGGSGDEDVFYYKVHSPVILVEFDHLPGIAFDNDFPTRQHIHTVVRTPNGNDYGKDLLRQHYQQAHGG